MTAFCTTSPEGLSYVRANVGSEVNRRSHQGGGKHMASEGAFGNRIPTGAFGNRISKSPSLAVVFMVKSMVYLKQVGAVAAMVTVSG